LHENGYNDEGNASKTEGRGKRSKRLALNLTKTESRRGNSPRWKGAINAIKHEEKKKGVLIQRGVKLQRIKQKIKENMGVAEREGKKTKIDGHTFGNCQHKSAMAEGGRGVKKVGGKTRGYRN